MAIRIERVYINGEKLKEIIAERGLTYQQFADELGRSKSYVENMIKTNVTRAGELKYIGFILNADIDELTTSPKVEENNISKSTDNIAITDMILNLQSQLSEIKTQLHAIKSVNQELDERMEDMSARLEQIYTNPPMNKGEECVCLLSFLTRAGGCEEKLFRKICQDRGYTEDMIDTAMKYLKCHYSVYSTGRWIERDRPSKKR